MKKFLYAVCCGAVMLFAAGCATVKEQTSASDITLAELEKRMAHATDPEGIFAKSKSCSMLQRITVKRFLDESAEHLVDVKIERPDKFALVTYTDNKPSVMWCSNGKQGWIADYSSRKVMTLDGEALRRMSVMAQISNPQESYSRIFPKVELFRCVNGSGDFYRIDCYGAGQASPIHIYVDAASYLIKRMRFNQPVGSGRIVYDAEIEQYEKREGVMIPVVTRIVQNGEKQECRITSYRLNVPIPETDFIPPVF